MQQMLQRAEKGGVLSCVGLAEPAQPFLSALIARHFPDRPLVIVTRGVKEQERVQQDVAIWMESGAQKNSIEIGTARKSSLPAMAEAGPRRALYYPSWEILPHESRLPHADVISERLETLLGLTSFDSSKGDWSPRRLL